MKSLTDSQLKQNIEWLLNHFDREPSPANVAYSYKRICDRFGGAVADWLHETTSRSSYFFRARKTTDVSEVEKHLPQSFSYPPRNCVSQGRANIAKHPVFYVADMPLEAIIETDKNYLTKSFYVACWRHDDSIKYTTYLYHPNGTGKRINGKFQEAYQTIKEKYPQHSQEAHRRMHELLKSISLLYLNDNHHLSSIISHHKLYNLKSIDGIAYAGVRSLQGINFAFRTDVADKMIIERMFKYSFENDRSVIEEIGEYNGSKIIWGKPVESDCSWNPDGLLNLDKEYIPGIRPDLPTYKANALGRQKAPLVPRSAFCCR